SGPEEVASERCRPWSARKRRMISFFCATDSYSSFRSLLATWYWSGQITVSAGTSRSASPFTSTVRSCDFTSSAASAPIQANATRPAKMKPPRMTAKERLEGMVMRPPCALVFSTASVDALGGDDVAQRAAGNRSVERVAGYQSKGRRCRLQQDAGPPRIDHVDLRDDEQVRAAARALYPERIAGREVAQEAEVRVAMPGDHAVPRVARQRARVQVTRAESERAPGAAREHDEVHLAASRGEPRQGPGVGPRPGCRLRLAALRPEPGALHQLLRDPRLRGDVGALRELPEAQAQQRAHDQRS